MLATFESLSLFKDWALTSFAEVWAVAAAVWTPITVVIGLLDFYAKCVFLRTLLDASKVIAFPKVILCSLATFGWFFFNFVISLSLRMKDLLFR